MGRPSSTRVSQSDQKDLVERAQKQEEAMKEQAKSSDGVKEQADSLLGAMEFFEEALGSSERGSALAENSEKIRAAFQDVVIKPLFGESSEPAHEQIKIVEFIKRVYEVSDADDESNEKLNSDGFDLGKNKMEVQDGRSMSIERTQETAAMDHQNLIAIADSYMEGDEENLPNTLKDWQNEMLGYRVTGLASKAIDQDRADSVDDFLKNARLQIPAKLRVAGLGNMREHSVTYKTKTGAEITSSVLPHASHDPHDLKNYKQEVKLAKKSIESVKDSQFGKDQRNNLKKVLNLDGKTEEEGRKVLMDCQGKLGVEFGEEDALNDMLDKVMPKFMTVDRLTSLFISKDLNTSEVINKAISEIQAEGGNGTKVLATHHTIQSGFTVFAAMSMPFLKSQNEVAADEINMQTRAALIILEQQLGTEPTYAEKAKINDKINILKSINNKFNKGLSSSNNAAIMYGGALRVSLGVFLAGGSALVATALLPVMPFLAAAAVATLAIGIPVAVINHYGFGANKTTEHYKGLKLASYTVIAAAAVIATAPVSLPILAGLSAMAVAGIAVSAGFVGAAGAMIASKFRDYSFLGGYKNSSSNHTWNAALQNLNVSLVGGIADLACHEGKDRTGTVLMMISAINEYISKNGECPDINNEKDQKELAESFDKIIMSGHDAERTSLNCAGAASVKKLKEYIPPAIYEKMQAETKAKIESYAKITKYFSLEETYGRSKILGLEFLKGKLEEFPLLKSDIMAEAKRSLEAAVTDLPKLPKGEVHSPEAIQNIQELDQIARGDATGEPRDFDDIKDEVEKEASGKAENGAGEKENEGVDNSRNFSEDLDSTGADQAERGLAKSAEAEQKRAEARSLAEDGFQSDDDLPDPQGVEEVDNIDNGPKPD